MPTLKVLAGDFLEGSGRFDRGIFMLRTKEHNFVGEKISVKELDAVEVANEETVKKVGGTLGWGAAGAALLGPVGLLAGLMLGGRKKEVTVVAKFKDGRKMLATIDNGTFTDIQAALFK
jgi:hypothetical protein